MRRRSIVVVQCHLILRSTFTTDDNRMINHKIFCKLGPRCWTVDEICRRHRRLALARFSKTRLWDTVLMESTLIYGVTGISSQHRVEWVEESSILSVVSIELRQICDRHRRTHRAMAYTALAQRCAIKTHHDPNTNSYPKPTNLTLNSVLLLCTNIKYAFRDCK